MADHIVLEPIYVDNTRMQMHVQTVLAHVLCRIIHLRTGMYVYTTGVVRVFGFGPAKETAPWKSKENLRKT